MDHLSIYLDVVDSDALPSGWSRYASLNLAVVSQTRQKLTIKQETEHMFNAKKSAWGFTLFMPLLDVHDITKGYLLDDTLIVEAEVGAQRVVDYGAYDAREHTGFVGLKNQGATSHTISVLQLFSLLENLCLSYFSSYSTKKIYHTLKFVRKLWLFILYRY